MNFDPSTSVTLADWLAAGNDPKQLWGRQVYFFRRYWRVAQFEGINPPEHSQSGTANLRYNGVTDADWMGTFPQDTSAVRLMVQADTNLPRRYDARPLTQR